MSALDVANAQQFNEIKPIEINKGVHKGIELSVDVGFSEGKGSLNYYDSYKKQQVLTQVNPGWGSLQIGLSKQLTQNIYAGITISPGLILGGDCFHTATADLKLNYPLNHSPLSLGIDFGAGGFFPGGFFHYSDGFIYGVGLIFHVIPTVRVPLSKSVDAVCGVGYTGLLHQEGGNSGCFSMKFGIRFHSSHKKGEPQGVRPPRRNRVKELMRDWLSEDNDK